MRHLKKDIVKPLFYEQQKLVTIPKEEDNLSHSAINNNLLYSPNMIETTWLVRFHQIDYVQVNEHAVLTKNEPELTKNSRNSWLCKIMN